ncbi:unnamed protein product [Symbiodinium natans]|uniref:Uncharacterized protein n=1 Tax=Symbiodinium natans TaxID=878477 RepID=A0A812Q2X5_9DINO|nr:unnamed protein product [Symbiodinium natans]
MTYVASSPSSGLNEARPALSGRSLKDPDVTALSGCPVSTVNEGGKSGNKSNARKRTNTGSGSSSEATTVASTGHDLASKASYPFLPNVVQADLSRSLPTRFGKEQALTGWCIRSKSSKALAPSSSKLCRLARGNSQLPTIDAASLAGLMKILNQVEAYFSSLSMLPATPMLFRHNNFYTPCSLEICVGQKVVLCPLVSHPPGCCLVVVPKLPLGLALDERSGLVHGRPQEPTPGQVKYHVVAHNPTRFPPKAHVACIELTVIDGWPASDGEGPESEGASSCD